MKVLTFSRHFPAGHPKQCQPTYFIEQTLNAILPRPLSVGLTELPSAARHLINDFFIIDGKLKKYHTIRAGSRFKPGEMVSLRVWSDKPYRSKQIEFAQVEVKKVWPIEIVIDDDIVYMKIDDVIIDTATEVLLAKNDGLGHSDFISWFAIHPKKKRQVFTGQVICWDDNINYV